MKAHEIKPGVIYKDANVTVTAFATKHAMESYEYRFETPDRTIVISGDTNPVEETIKACNGCDMLSGILALFGQARYRADLDAY